MDIDHIFIFTDNKGKAADDLVSFGLTEGESRVHEGQGTTNRTFVFDNFFLEVLWVHNEQEIKSDLIRPTGLWKRANYRVNSCSPFGVCITNTDETEQLFKNAFNYQPDYFPSGMTIDILNNNTNLDLPWIFRLPFRREKKETKQSAHKNGISILTNADFQYTDKGENQLLDHFKNEEKILFSFGDETWLTLTFDNGIQGLSQKFDNLKLTVNY